MHLSRLVPPEGADHEDEVACQVEPELVAVLVVGPLEVDVAGHGDYW